ncbi:hypothetical protein ACFFUB_10900 [Algimonas porphyrae]|uniref:SH3 domain-containing protein n=1 Tax=Algimonas porphyrae TaxID=1128113 RepID=A0ABQ5V1E5_9PROT|nr:hypothetical protein [Algimonas porphyrae]GLQ21375.1 hypothetical protein GCM10007854_23300 [Algimonas porphyrae]
MKYWFSALALCALTVPAAAQEFHSDPSCWTKPRIYHAGAPGAEMASRIERTPNVTRTARDTALLSPNGAYKLWVEIPNRPSGNLADQILYIDSEEGRVTRFYIAQSQSPLSPRWVNEKLVFLRVAWGRISFTDLLIDAESGEIIYQEAAMAGDIAFEQFKQACGNSCPCDPSVLEAVTPPPSSPADGEVIGYLQIDRLLNRRAQAGAGAEDEAAETLPVHADINGTKMELARLAEADAILTDDRKEWQSALVYAREPGWYQIGLSGDGQRKVWVKASDIQAFTSRPERWIGGLAYLGPHWDGRVWQNPDGSGGYVMSPLHQPGLQNPEYAANFTQMRQTETGPWLRVTIHDGDDCTRSDGTIVSEGWVPAWSVQGKPVGGDYPGGC